MKKSMFVFVGLLLSLLTFGQLQEQSISWVTTTHDFGVIKEEGGLQSFQYDFVNKGKEAIYITKVDVSCGCTATDYTKEPIQPGAKGYVIATYNPLGRPGKFTKSVTVNTNEVQPTTVLRFEGEVTPKPVETTN